MNTVQSARPEVQAEPMTRRLEAPKNYATAYEIAITTGDRRYLVCYSQGRSRDGIIRAVRAESRAQKLVTFTGSTEFAFGPKATDGLQMGEWRVAWTGRTERQAIIEGELPHFTDALPPEPEPASPPAPEPEPEPPAPVAEPSRLCLPARALRAAIKALSSVAGPSAIEAPTSRAFLRCGQSGTWLGASAGPVAFLARVIDREEAPALHCVPWGRLKRITELVTCDRLGLTLSAEGNVLGVEASGQKGGLSASFQLATTQAYAVGVPVFPPFAHEECWTVEAPDIIRAIEQCQTSITSRRPELSGVFLQCGDEGLTLIATDGSKLTRANVDASRTGSTPDKPRMIPSAALRALVAMAKQSGGPVRIVFEEETIAHGGKATERRTAHYLRVHTQDMDLRITLDAHASLPKFSEEGVFPTDRIATIAIGAPSGFSKAVKVAHADRKEDGAVTIAWDGSRLVVRSECGNEITQVAEVEGAPFARTFDGKTLLTYAKSNAKAQSLTIGITPDTEVKGAPSFGPIIFAAVPGSEIAIMAIDKPEPREREEDHASAEVIAHSEPVAEPERVPYCSPEPVPTVPGRSSEEGDIPLDCDRFRFHRAYAEGNPAAVFAWDADRGLWINCVGVTMFDREANGQYRSGSLAAMPTVDAPGIPQEATPAPDVAPPGPIDADAPEAMPGPSIIGTLATHPLPARVNLVKVAPWGGLPRVYEKVSADLWQGPMGWTLDAGQLAYNVRNRSVIILGVEAPEPTPEPTETPADPEPAYQLDPTPEPDPIDALPWRVRPVARFLRSERWTVEGLARVERFSLNPRMLTDDVSLDDLIAFDEQAKEFKRLARLATPTPEPDPAPEPPTPPAPDFSEDTPSPGFSGPGWAIGAELGMMLAPVCGGSPDADDSVMDTTDVGSKIHPFTRSGMGQAPFRLCGEDAEHRKLRLGGGFGCCDACGKIGLARIFYVKSSDGKVSSVGSNCVAKIADADPVLADKVDSLVKAHERKERQAKKTAKAVRVEEIIGRLNDPTVREHLGDRPHPKGWAGKTLLDWAMWMADNAGAKGRAEVADLIERLTPQPDPTPDGPDGVPPEAPGGFAEPAPAPLPDSPPPLSGGGPVAVEETWCANCQVWHESFEPCGGSGPWWEWGAEQEEARKPAPFEVRPFPGGFELVPIPTEDGPTDPDDEPSFPEEDADDATDAVRQDNRDPGCDMPTDRVDNLLDGVATTPESLTVGGASYTVQETADGFDLTNPRGETYRVTLGPMGPSCECPSYRYRHEAFPGYLCKHLAAIRDAGLIPVQEPTPCPDASPCPNPAPLATAGTATTPNPTGRAASPPSPVGTSSPAPCSPTSPSTPTTPSMDPGPPMPASSTTEDGATTTESDTSPSRCRWCGWPSAADLCPDCARYLPRPDEDAMPPPDEQDTPVPDFSEMLSDFGLAPISGGGPEDDDLVQACRNLIVRYAQVRERLAGLGQEALDSIGREVDAIDDIIGKLAGK